MKPPCKRINGGKDMTLKFTVTEQDYINFNLHHRKTSKTGKRGKIANILILIPAFFLGFWLANRIDDEPVDVYFFVFFGIMAAIALPLLFLLFTFLDKLIVRWTAKSMLKDGKNNDFLGEQTVIFHEDCIEDINAHSQSRVPYTSIEKINFGYDCYYIYMGAIKANIIPLSAFADDAQRQEFLELLKQRTGLDAVHSKK